MPHITHPNGQTTHYLLDNLPNPQDQKATILIQHGFGRHSAFWSSWITPLTSAGYSVLRRDARGHGHSSVPSTQTYTYSIETILSEILDTLDQLQIPKVHYLGESTGGIWGEFLAAKHPERILSLTICASPLYMPRAAQAMLAFGYSSWAEACREMGARRWGEELAKAVGTGKYEEEGFMEWWLGEFGVSSGKGLGDHAELLCREEFDARRVVEGINVPMLILTPEGSALVNKEEQRWLKETVEGARMEVISGRGHEIYLDQAEVCQGKFLEFLDSLSK